MKNKNSAFTLLEILLVVGIIAILAGIVIIAINPGKQLAQVRNSQRKSDIKAISNAITQFYIDHSYYPASTTFSTTSLMAICPTGASSSPAVGFNCAANNMLNLSELVPTYLVAIPNDPVTTTISGYSVMLANNQPVVSAPLAELGVKVAIGNISNSCGDPTKAACWSAQFDNLSWGPSFELTSIQNITTGSANTAALIQRETLYSENYPAAHYCATLNDGAYPVGTWYLPAKSQLLTGFGVLGSGFFPSNAYWSSTESDSNNAWYLFRYYGDMYSLYKNNPFSVRCLR